MIIPNIWKHIPNHQPVLVDLLNMVISPCEDSPTEFLPAPAEWSPTSSRWPAGPTWSEIGSAFDGYPWEIPKLNDGRSGIPHDFRNLHDLEILGSYIFVAGWCSIVRHVKFDEALEHDGYCNHHKLTGLEH